jgi:hypothetical protein
MHLLHVEPQNDTLCSSHPRIYLKSTDALGSGLPSSEFVQQTAQFHMQHLIAYGKHGSNASGRVHFLITVECEDRYQSC